MGLPAPDVEDGRDAPELRGELAQAPVARTVMFLVLGFLIMVAGIASLTN